MTRRWAAAAYHLAAGTAATTLAAAASLLATSTSGKRAIWLAVTVTVAAGVGTRHAIHDRHPKEH